MGKVTAKRSAGGLQADQLREFRDYLTSRTGLNLRSDKSGEFKETVRKRLAEKYPDLDVSEYYSLIRGEGDGGPELRFLISRLTVGETYFFRNRPQIHALQNFILPEIIRRRRSKGKMIRIWSAGCSTGEEPYSIAMLLLELLPDISDWAVTLLATDINEEALSAARRGMYRNWSFREIDDYNRRRYFIVEGRDWKIRPEVSQLVTFRRLNLAEDLYPAVVNRTDELDLIVCRNVMIYFSTELNLEITRRFYRCLREDGYLMVGHSEHSDMIYPRLQRKMYGSTIAYQRGGPGICWERAIKLRFRGSGKPAEPVLFHGETTGGSVPGTQRPPETEETVKFEKAVALYKERRLEESLNGFREIVGQNPGNERARYMAALLSADCGDMEMAEKEARTILAANPLHLKAMYLMSLICRVRGDGGGEIEYLKKTVYLDRGFVLGHFQMGVYYLRSGNDRLAQRSLQNVLEIVENVDDSTFIDGIDGLTVGRLRQSILEMMPGKGPGGAHR